MTSLTNMPLKVISAGVFELGKVKLDKSRREVTFPARLNLKQGPMEYFLVTSYGKTHESVLRTDVRPFYIHIAMLLLGANASSVTNSGPLPQGGFLANPSSVQLPGDKIAIEVSWTAEGKQIRKPAAELLYNEQAQKPMEKGNWIYNGSRVVQGYFVSQMGGSVVSLVTDSDALANNEGKGHDNDKIWAVNTNSLPPMNEPLEVTFRLLDDKTKQ